MRRKRGNTNIKILQSQIQNFAISEESKLTQKPVNEEIKLTARGMNNESVDAKLNAYGRDLPVVEKIKKKGIKKDELINTKRLLTM